MHTEKPFSERDIDGMVEEILRSRAAAKKVTVPPSEELPKQEPPERESRIPAEERETSSKDEDVRIYIPPKKAEKSAEAEEKPLAEKAVEQVSQEIETETEAPTVPVSSKKRTIVPPSAPQGVDDTVRRAEPTSGGADEATRRVELPPEYDAAPSEAAEPAEEQIDEELEGQLSWSDVTETEIPEEEPITEDAEMEEQLRLAREEKIRSFRMARGMKLSGDEEENEPEEEPEAAEEPEYLEDFTDYEDAQTVRSELYYRLNRGRIGAFVTLVWEVMLICTAVLFSVGVITNPYLYVVDSVVVLLIMMLINHALFRDGWEDLREGKAGSETAVGLVSALTLVHTLVQLFTPEAADNRLLPALAGFGLLLAACNRQLHLRRIVRNFEFVAREGEKWAAKRVEDPKDANEIGRAAVAVGQPEVAYFRPVPFLHHYLGRAYERYEEAPFLQWYLPAMGIVSLLCALVYAIAFGSVGDGFTLFVMLCALSAPVASGVAVSFPLLRGAKRIEKKGGMLVGQAAVERFGRLHALAVDAADLFPDHCMLLGGIKTFSGTRIDEAILDAAAVSITAGGPLSHVFRRIIQNRTDLLEEVDTLVYEQEMGLSGWVGGRRVLVGNRRLLENHGVDVPSRDYEMKYSRNGRQLVYLSTAGELSAMFIVTYDVDEEIAASVRAMNKEDITLLVRTCDPNVTQELICSTLGLDDYYVEILGTSARRRYEQLVGEEPTETDAELACDGSIGAKTAALTYANRLRVGGKLALIAALVAAVLGAVLFALTSFLTGRLVSVLYPLAYMLVSTLPALIIPLIKKV